MKKAKRKEEGGLSAADWAEFEAKSALENRLGELLLTCEGIAIGMSADFVFEVWGKLRFRPGLGMVRLSAAPGDLREAVRLAYQAAREMEMSRIGAVNGSPPVEGQEALNP